MQDAQESERSRAYYEVEDHGMVATPDHDRDDVEEIIPVNRRGMRQLFWEMNKSSSSGKGTVMLRTYRVLVAHIPHEAMAPSERVRWRMLRKAFRNRRQCCVLGVVFCVCLSVAFAPPLMAQAAGMGALTGKLVDASGHPVANATVTATNIDNGQVRSATTGTDGSYKFEGLPPGNYRLKFEAAGFKTLELPSAAVDGTETALPDEKLEAGETIPANPSPVQQENLPNAPSSSKTEPTLADLGLSPEQTQGNAREQALLDKRTHMLKIHQRMGLITAGPLIATVIASMGAGGKSTSTASRDLHVALGSLTGDLYGITAYYAIRAPRIPGTKKRGPIKFHEAMAWIHGPGMILTPILGAMAFNQKSNGEKVHGIASAHGPVAIVTAGAFGAALLSVSVKF